MPARCLPDAAPPSVLAVLGTSGGVTDAELLDRVWPRGTGWPSTDWSTRRRQATPECWQSLSTGNGRTYVPPTRRPGGLSGDDEK
jgi:hypothetical protein